MDLRTDALTILHRALQAVDPGELFRINVRVEEGCLTIAGQKIPPCPPFLRGGKKVIASEAKQSRSAEQIPPTPLDKGGKTQHAEERFSPLKKGGSKGGILTGGKIIVIGTGKGTAPMGQAVEEILGDRISAGAITVKYGHGLPLKKIKVFEAGHPVPDQATLEGTAAILNLLKGLNEDDLVLALITGGGSALLELPAGSLTLEDLQATTQALLASGADITEMNAVRRHLSQVKGGRLAQAAHPARLVTLAVSDVIGDPPESISSGPTAPDPSTFADAWRVIEKYSLQDKLPQAVIKHLREGAEGKIPDTPKKDDFVQEEEVRHSCLTEDSNSDRQECLSSTYKVKRNDRQECLSSTNKLKLRASYHIIGSNRIMLEAARQEAEKLGYQTEVLTDRLSGEAREQGRQLARLIKEKQVSGKPVCLLAGGEPTVTIRGEGKGGRNQELALAAAIELAGSHDCLLLSAGSDGTDGPTDAAGALADGTTIHRAEALSLNAQDYLDRNDSYPFFQALGDLVITGPTRTNVMDIIIMLSI